MTEAWSVATTSAALSAAAVIETSPVWSAGFRTCTHKFKHVTNANEGWAAMRSLHLGTGELKLTVAGAELDHPLPANSLGRAVEEVREREARRPDEVVSLVRGLVRVLVYHLLSQACPL